MPDFCQLRGSIITELPVFIQNTVDGSEKRREAANARFGIRQRGKDRETLCIERSKEMSILHNGIQSLAQAEEFLFLKKKPVDTDA